MNHVKDDITRKVTAEMKSNREVGNGQEKDYNDDIKERVVCHWVRWHYHCSLQFVVDFGTSPLIQPYVYNK